MYNFILSTYVDGKVIDMKKIFTLLMAAVMICTALSVPAAAKEDAPIAVMLDGKYIEFDVEPAMINDRTMVPVRAIFEALGASVGWIEGSETAISKMGDTQIAIKINDNFLIKNGEPIALDVPAQLVGKRTLVPVRAISEAYGCYVGWNEWDNTVIIVSDLNKTPIATVNGENISVGYFNFVLGQVEAYAMQTFNCSADEIKRIWNSTLGSTSFGEYMASTTLEQCVYTRANAIKAKSKGIKLSSSDKSSIEANIKNIADAYGDAFAQYLKKMGTTQEAMEQFYEDNIYAEKYYDVLFDEAQMSDSQIKKYLDDNYIRAKHILFSTVDENTNEPLSSEKAAAKKALAESTLAKIKSGHNFDNLVKELGEDPGAAQNPNGYLFTKGDMVKEFENAAYALSIDGVSEIVESQYGYHIIKRVSNGTYSEEEMSQVSTYLADNKVSAVMNENKEGADVTSDANMIGNVVPIDFE